MRNAFVLMAAMLILSIPALALPNNDGSVWTSPFSGHVLSQDLDRTACNILYCPADNDAAGFRTGLAAMTGGAVDYFDAREATPSLELMQDYQVVLTYPNNAYHDMVAMGDMLADYADLDYIVILAVWCTYTRGYYLSGRIMTPEYCPVVSPGGNNHYSFATYMDDGASCIFTEVYTFEQSCRDYLVAQGDGVVDGTYDDGEVAAAYNGKVFYANGNPEDGNADWVRMIYNMACLCSDTPATETSTWSCVKTLY